MFRFILRTSHNVLARNALPGCSSSSASLHSFMKQDPSKMTNRLTGMYAFLRALIKSLAHVLCFDCFKKDTAPTCLPSHVPQKVQMSVCKHE